MKHWQPCIDSHKQPNTDQRFLLPMSLKSEPPFWEYLYGRVYIHISTQDDEKTGSSAPSREEGLLVWVFREVRTRRSAAREAHENQG